jgi:hypothetical protein
MQTGDLVEWHENSILGEGIRLRTGYDVNHSSLVVVLNSPYMGKRVLLFEALADGIDITFASQRFGADNGHVFYYKVKDAVAPKIPLIEGIAFGYVGTPYDYVGIAEILMLGHQMIGDDKRIFCSKFVEVAHGGEPHDIAYWPGELPQKMQHWQTRVQLY